MNVINTIAAKIYHHRRPPSVVALISNSCNYHDTQLTTIRLTNKLIDDNNQQTTVSLGFIQCLDESTQTMCLVGQIYIVVRGHQF